MNALLPALAISDATLLIAMPFLVAVAQQYRILKRKDEMLARHYKRRYSNING